MSNHFTLDPVAHPSIPDGDDLTYLADVLVDLTLPECTAQTATMASSTTPSGPVPMVGRDEATVVIDLFNHDHPQPAEVWALSDDSEVGRVLSPPTMRRLRLRWIRHRTGMESASSKAVYYPSIRGFAQRHARRLTARRPDLGPRVQHRIEGFLHLDDDEFNACYNYLGDPTPEYLQLSRRLDDHPLDDGNQPSPTAAGDRHRRRAKSYLLGLGHRSS